ncbi:SUMO-activating enzyme subunit 1 [Diabrotica undecimpunctata]|uniref:SUMO-activating enzyme subunit 1 n=1 Tax=Diabrotica undecimpunctata TaxID=50387 RepID=UPI003B637A2C
MTEKQPKQLSAAEAELYDRQIRLWGIESQEKLRAANVLLINIRALGSEIAKNILLSGINSLTILDDGIVTEKEQAKNFLIGGNRTGDKIAEAVLERAQALNPLVTIKADSDSPASKDPSFFKDFTIIVATCVKTDVLLKIDKVCRANNIKLIAGDVFGLFGYSVADFQNHQYHEDQIQLVKKGKKRTHKGEKVTVKVQCEINYPDLNKVLILPNTKQNIDSIKKSKRRNDLFYLVLILLEFRNRVERNPDPSNEQDDIKTLQKIKNDIFELYQVDELKSKLTDSHFDLIFSEIGPVCAILGGVIAQEVIKAVSHKEVPINNMFLFDPITYDGTEENVGA